MSIPDLEALIFDGDGTLADTESAHLAAFNQAFAEFGLDWHWDEALCTDLMNISGGKERIQQYWKTSQPELRELEAMAHGVQLAITTPPPRPSKSRIRRSIGRCCRCSSLRQRTPCAA